MAVDTTAISFRQMIVKSSVPSAEQMIIKWDPGAPRSAYANVASIFLESRDEARRYLSAVYDLRKGMEKTLTEETSESAAGGTRFRRRILMNIAMKRLQKEFVEILHFNRDASPVPPPSPPDEPSSTFRSYVDGYGSDGETYFPPAALDYLRSLAECMIACGKMHDCVEAYCRSRRAVLDEGLLRLGIESVSISQVQKLNWESLDFRIKQWLTAAKPVFSEIFSGERFLADSVFSSDQDIAEACFAEITRDAAVQFFRFPSAMASKHKKPPEKVVHYLNMYRSVKELSPEIEATFSSKVSSAVISQVNETMLVLTCVLRNMLADFETGIQKDASRSVHQNAGVHALNQRVMNHLVVLADFSDFLGELYADEPLPPPTYASPRQSVSSKSEKLEPIEEEDDDDGAAEDDEEEEEEEDEEGDLALQAQGVGTTATSRLTWILTILLCKLDAKAELYREAPQSYLFLANNHQYVVNRVKESKLSQLLGGEWVRSHEAKARSFARNFLKLSWQKVLDAVPADLSELPTVEARRERMVRFNKLFEEACRTQTGWVVADRETRNEIKSAVARNLIGRYRPFYEMCRTELRVDGGPPAAVRFAPQDLMTHLSGLYRERSGSFSAELHRSTSCGSGSGGSGKKSRWKWLRESR